MSTYELVTAASIDGETVINISENEAKRIEFIRGLIEDDPDQNSIPLHLSHRVVNKVVEYVRILEEIPEPTIQEPLQTSRFSDCVPNPICKILDIPKDDLFELMEAADFLQMEKLLNIIGALMACKLMKMTNDEKRDFLNLEDDLSLQNRADINKENIFLNM